MSLPSPPSLSFPAFLSLIRTPSPYTVFPIYQTLDADLDTPISVYLKLCHDPSSATSASPPLTHNSFLFESVKNNEYQSRYSYIGCEPHQLLIQNDVDPLIALQAAMSPYIAYPVPDLPDFSGGAVGYIAYDCIGHFEKKVNVPHKHTLQTPQSIFMMCSSVVILDHVKQSMHTVAQVFLSQTHRLCTDDEIKVVYDQATERIKILVNRLTQPLPHALHTHTPALSSPTTPSGVSPALTSNVGAEGYKSFVSILKENIIAGNIIQAVPSQRLSRPLQHNINAFDIYRSLRVVNHSPYMFYLDFGSFQICGASPEQLVKVEGQTGKVTTHPIAGTRKRGKTAAEDALLEQELLSNEKERAEHIMLVDLGRNDIGKVSVPGTVRVESLMHVEKYSHVMHIVSVVSGKLSPNLSIYDAFRSVFPAGTVTGAPKIRAMQLIAELEQEQRGVYAGAVGFVSYSGTLDTAIAIRTMVVKDGIAYLQAGAGIVYDSVPAAEEKETIKKLLATIQSLTSRNTHHHEEEQKTKFICLIPSSCLCVLCTF